MSRDVIEEQIRYYRRRAVEYDETADWRKDPFESEWRSVVAALDGFGPVGRVLEIACGTGQWTTRLMQHADEVTALDASPEMIAINQSKLDDPRVTYVVGNVFEWRPDRRYDVVFFANWLSHVLPQDLARFWALVRSALRPDGRVFFVDESQDAAWRREEPTDVAHVVIRRLRDGSTFRAVKVFWEPDELEGLLRGLGWDVRVTGLRALLYGEGRAAGDR